ncbi:MAG: imidazolonepropionase [Ignavibacteriales bacterium]|nr:imidazolonepropionase [Ignavibacteriales bacterium]
MITLIANPSQIVTVDSKGKNYKRGKELGEIDVLTEHSILVEDDLIKDFIPNQSINYSQLDAIINVKDKVVFPGFVDCHTHTVFAGSRAEEFKMKIAGASYEEIAKAGGGINKTVQAVRKLSFEDLVEISKPRIIYAISQGITTLEIKSGYGLSFDDEIKLLNVINHLNNIFPIDIIPTFLGAHTFPPEYKSDQEKYISLINEKMLPFIANNKLAKFCDAFCEKTAFSAEQIDRIFQTASSLGLKLKLHTDQFNSIGGIDLGLKHKVVSLEHLEVVKNEDILKLGNTDIVCVLLPGVSFFLHYGFAPARDLISKNAIVALSTDYNPGSSHISNINLIMSLAAIEMKMTIEETISAVTINAAKALDVNNSVGSIEIGKKADFAILDTQEYPDIVYNVGKNLNCMTIKNGKIIYKNI